LRLAFTTSLIALLLSHAAFSQVRLITGRLLDAETQKPVKNATVTVLGTTDGTISSPFGYFQIKIDPTKHKTLVVSHIGFKTADVTIPEADNFKFFLKKAFVFLQPIDLNLYPKDTTGLHPLQELAPAESGLAESNATFPRGLDAFYMYIGNALSKEIPPLPLPNFTITFTIDESGKASNLDVSDSTHRVAVGRVFQNMPAWVPATQQRTNVPQHFSLPIGALPPTPPAISITVSEFNTYMAQNLRFPAEARSMSVEGVVYAQFRVDDAGNVISVMLLKDIGGNCGGEVKRVLSTLPATLGKSLSAKTKASDFILPVSFGIGKPFETEISIPGTSARLLTEIQLTAMAVERVQRATPPQYVRRPSATATGSKRTTEEFVSLEKALKSKATRLSLIDKGLSSFPSEILQLNELIYLDLEKNQLNDLPDNLHSLTKLEELYPFENKIETLPRSFGNLKKLKILGLGSNQLQTFPNEITQLEKLETLDLGGNKIASLPPSIAALKNLKFLVLHDNNITHIPEAFYALKKLQKIYLQGNPIDPKDLERLKKSFDKAEIVF
jgi:hypothetical protein